MKKKNISKLSAIHATSDVEAKEVNELYPGIKVCIAPHGISLPKKVNSMERCMLQPLRLLFLSRINKKKNIPMLIEAVSLAIKNKLPVRLKIAGGTDSGDDKYLFVLLALCEKLGIQDYVEFVGFLDGKEKEEAFQNSHVFILPSFQENFGIAVAEAMSYSLPVIVSEEVALSKEIREFGCGWVLKDLSVDSIFGAIKAVLGDEVSRMKCSLMARNVAEQKFSWKENAVVLEKLYVTIKGCSIL